jgi:Domain of unknown function (DUF5667)
MSEHRVPMLGASWRRFEDPTLSRDPRIRELVSALATLPSPEPRPEFRAELRAQLVAIAPRVIAESAADTVPFVEVPPSREPARTAARPRHTDSVFARLRGISLGRPLAVAASVLTAFVMLFGGAVWASQKALPGDALYGLKRASESAQLTFDSSPTAKARDYLSFAKERTDEVDGLLNRSGSSAAGVGVHAGGIDSHTADLIESTLSSSDSDVMSASTLLAKQAVKSKSTTPLTVITSWAPAQLARLNDLATRMPDSSLRSRTESSARLVSQAVTRARQLAPAVASGCDTTTTDDLGVVPSACRTGSSARTKSGTGPTGTRRTKNQGGGSNTGSSNTTPDGQNGTSPSPAPSSSPSSSGLVPPVLPTDTSSPPLVITSCSAGVNLPVIGIGLGNCPS